MAQRCEPNITPLIDIVLVLLIVFMVMVPGLQVAAMVNLPAKGAAGGSGLPPLKVRLTKDGALSLEGRPVAERDLARAVEEALRARAAADRRVLIALHGTFPFQRAADLLDAVKGRHPDLPVALVEAQE